MRFVRLATYLLTISFYFYSNHAFANASLVVDNATVTPERTCQAELWGRTYTPGQEFTARYGCNIRNSEVGIGFSYHNEDENELIIGIGNKRILRDLETHNVAVAVSGDILWNVDKGEWDTWLLNIPVTTALNQDKTTLLHLNVGWLGTNGDKPVLVGGVGFEYLINSNWTFLSDVFGENNGFYGVEMGVRRTVSSRSSIDLIAGHEDDNGITDNSLTLGFNMALTF